MYHNQVAFYYKDNAADLEINNKLCIVGAEVKGFFDEILTYYYFGLYENLRGKNNLINPDPYAEGEDKYILKNFKLEFISPVISTVDPKTIIDQTSKQNQIPSSELTISLDEAEKKLANLGFAYEMKIKDLDRKNKQDQLKAQQILKDYQSSRNKLNQEVIKLTDEVNNYLKNRFYIQERSKRASGGLLDEGDTLKLFRNMNEKKRA